MHWKTPKLRKPKAPNLGDWHQWFAWHLVRCGPETYWLETVERRWFYNKQKAYIANYHGEWQYRKLTT